MIFILGELSMQVNDVAITMLFMKLKFALTFLLHNFSLTKPDRVESSSAISDNINLMAP